MKEKMKLLLYHYNIEDLEKAIIELRIKREVILNIDCFNNIKEALIS